MNALPHTSNPKLTEPTSPPVNQVPTLPVVTVLKLSTCIFFPLLRKQWYDHVPKRLLRPPSPDVTSHP